MFEKFARTPSRKASTPKVELEMTVKFLRALSGEGLRLSYAALTLAARAFEEDSSGQIAAQRGAKLVKSLPQDLQPFVCRRKGGYARGVLKSFEEAPENLLDLPVIGKESVHEAVEAFLASLG